MDSQLFVQNVKKYCKMKGVKPTPACLDSGVGKSFISDIERGQKPSIEKVQMLATYLGVSTSDLLGEEIIFGEGDKMDPSYRELRYIIDNASGTDRRKFLDLIRIYKGFETDAAERRKTRNGPAKSEAAEKKDEQLFECGELLEPGIYKCVGCGQTTFVIHDKGETIAPCGICNSNYFCKITKACS